MAKGWGPFFEVTRRFRRMCSRGLSDVALTSRATRMTVGGESPPPGRAESGKVPHLEGGVVDREKARLCERVGRCEPGEREERVESDEAV